VGLLAALLLAPVDRTPFAQTDYFAQDQAQLAQVDFRLPPRPDSLRAGWAKVNITPPEPAYLAGYGISRGQYTAVHDSTFLRVIYLAQGSQQAAIVGADLAVFPPRVVAALPRHLPDDGPSVAELYFTATHTHHGAGGWADHPAGRLLAGPFSAKEVERLAQAVAQALAQARAQARPAQVGFASMAAPAFVHHRLVTGRPVDDRLHLLKIRQLAGPEALVVAYQAHATCNVPHLAELSRDYPGYLVDALEQSPARPFALFAAGAVASHAPHLANQPEGYGLAQGLGEGLAALARSCADTLATQPVDGLGCWQIPVSFGPAQLRVSQGWRVRSWAFDALLGQRELFIKVLKIGKLTLIGLPADYSGELRRELDQRLPPGTGPLLITSFNGGYTGYLTPDHYYDTLVAPEIREMNWVGPGKGEMTQQLLEAILRKGTEK
jgi:hypothetical protein